MRNKIKLAIFLLFFACGSFYTRAQKIITLDQELASNSEPMRVKLKAGTGMVKYQFGEFAVISTKNKDNEVKNNESRDTLGLYESYSLKQYKEDIWGNIEKEQNFVFLGYQKDSILANMTTLFDYNSTLYSEYRPGTREETTIIKNSKEKFVAFLTPTSDRPSWLVEMNTQLGKEVQAPGGIITEGQLTDGVSIIEINPVRTWSNGKSSKLFPILGFEFNQDGEFLAAVQSNGNVSSKNYVWIRNDLPKELRLILASAATTLMAMVDNQTSRLLK